MLFTISGYSIGESQLVLKISSEKLLEREFFHIGIQAAVHRPGELRGLCESSEEIGFYPFLIWKLTSVFCLVYISHHLRRLSTGNILPLSAGSAFTAFPGYLCSERL